MRILLLAPEISTPYSEGRKRFVLDLISELKHHDEVFLLTTTKIGQQTDVPIPYQTAELGHGALHLFYLFWQLPKVIKRFRPQLVCVFPHGTFRHLYGYASVCFMWSIDQICRNYQVPCQTIMYSIDEYSEPQRLQKYVSCLAMSQRKDWDGAVVNLGISCNDWPQYLCCSVSEKTLLFMAGMWEQTPQRIEHVIHVRGLGSLLQAGKFLAANGVHIIIAAPLFASSQCQDYLYKHPLNTWPSEHIKFRAIAKVPEIYREADLFVFPYQLNITHFVPTSVLEAMLSGLCVALSDRDFLLPLAQNEKTAYLFPANDPEKMATVLLDALNSKQARQEKVQNAQHYVRENWCIEVSVKQIRTLAHSMGYSG